jgi:hypothetical protein
MPGIIEQLVADTLTETLRLRHLPLPEDAFAVISKRYQQLISTGFAYADRDKPQASPVWQDRLTPASADDLRLAAIHLAAAALHLAIEGSLIFHYTPQFEERSAHVG